MAPAPSQHQLAAPARHLVSCLLASLPTRFNGRQLPPPVRPMPENATNPPLLAPCCLPLPLSNQPPHSCPASADEGQSGSGALPLGLGDTGCWDWDDSCDKNYLNPMLSLVRAGDCRQLNAELDSKCKFKVKCEAD
jgi:hypothetical protein